MSRLLYSCKNLSSLLQVHAQLIVSGFRNHRVTNTQLVTSYISFQECSFARLVFDSMEEPGVALYNYMIRGYARDGMYHDAIGLYRLVLLDEGLEPDKYTFNFVLKACTGAKEFEAGVLVHKHVVFAGLERDAFIGCSLIDMYGKMGDMAMARQVFDRMPKKDVVPWNAMILGLSQGGCPSEAYRLISRMQSSGLEPNLVSILNLVPAVSRLGDIGACRSIHGYVTRRGFSDIVSNGLIDMYAKCGDIDVACQIFERMRDRDDVSWRTMMAGYAHNGCCQEVLELFDCRKRENHAMSKASVVTALIAAAEMKDLEKGKDIHNCARQQGTDSDVSVATPIITMYVKCGDPDKAVELFQGLKGKDLVTWSATIVAFIQSGYHEEAMSLFREMQNECFKANEITLLSVLPACAEISSVRLGKSVHCYVIKANMDTDLAVGTTLVSMYAKCGLFSSALTTFNRISHKDIVAWNAMINGHTQVGNLYCAVEMFRTLCLSETRPDSGTMVGLLTTCAFLYDIHQGSCIHGQIIKSGFDCDCHVKNSLIDMYAKCGSLSSAEFLFNETEFLKEEVSWNVMIAGYMHNGLAKEAIIVFSQMKSENYRPNLVTIVTVLPAAALLSALKEGMTLHAYTIRMGFVSSTLVGNSLIDMYAKCAHLDFSENVFFEMRNKDVASWNAMIAGYAINGHANHAIEFFSLMQENCIRVDKLSFINVLSACRHSGLVEEGKKLFDSMRKEYKIEPDLEHYACMVDLLGRAGLFDQILDLMKTMPMEPDAGIWGALLGACIMHSNVQLAEFALDHLVKLEPRNPIHYVALSSAYINSGRWGDAGNIRSKMIKTGLRKGPGCSWV